MPLIKTVPTQTLSPSRPEASRNVRLPVLRILIAALFCPILIGLSVLWIDRPVATWVHQHLGDARFALFRMSYDGYSLPIGPFSFLAGPAEALGRLSQVALVVLALAVASGRRLQARGRVALAVSLSVMVALQINREAKLVFGRAWPESWRGDNPSWIHDGVFGFFPFHGGSSWGSFPSGHTTVITTFATLLWLVWPKLRGLWAALVIMVVVGLIGGNYHFVSDTIGGLYLGGAIGLGGYVLMQAGWDRQAGPGRPG